MKYTDIVMVIENYKGTEYNCLLTETDAFNRVLRTKALSESGTADFFTEFGKTIAEGKEPGEGAWATVYLAANHTISMSYCHSEVELIGFLEGNFNDEEKDWQFDHGECSLKCIKFLSDHKIAEDGSRLGLPEYVYKPVEHEFKQGEELMNLNGNRYKVLQCFSEKNLLVMDMRSGQFAVGIDTGMFERRLKSGGDEAVKGIEWEHGLYLGNMPSQINFELLRHRYGEQQKEEKDEMKEYQIEIKEALERVVTVDADNLDEAIDKVVEMYDAGEIVLDAEDFKGKEIVPHQDRIL